MATENKNLSFYDKSTVPNVSHLRFGIVVSQWNSKITNALYKAAYDTLVVNKVAQENITKWEVPGSFELIYGATLMGEKVSVNAIIVIGSVIRGETPHFDYVCQAVSHGIKDLNMQLDIPIIFGVLTDDTMLQAINRSGGKYGNKGIGYAITAMKMAALRDQFPVRVKVITYFIS